MKMYNKRPSLYTFDGDNGTQGLCDKIQFWNLVTNFIMVKEVNPKLISTKRFFPYNNNIINVSKSFIRKIILLFFTLIFHLL